ncbi:MAG: nucleotidyltransferase domain-containing protein [Candidatus Doudnabacteria bacterium]|nr:nucleotidyltransferase domain-containing protein [Candidatus Doudnabacteria bacterium]
MKIRYDQKRLAQVANKFGLKFVILHGSFAIGSTHKESDLDIAVLGKNDIGFDELLKLHGELSDVFKLTQGADLDLKTLHKIDPLFRYEVTRTGRLLYGSPVNYEEYKAYTLRAMEDARPLLELERQLAYRFQDHLNALYVK